MRRLGLMLLLIASSITSIWVQGQNQATSPATPTLIKFGGTINSASGTLNVIFALYAEQTGGAPLWLETQTVNLDAKGHYNILLGANHANGVPVDLFASGEARWLGVQPDGQAEQARVMLVSVPYALKAADADTLGGQPLSAFVMASAANGSTTTASSAAATNASGGGVVALATPQGTGTDVTTSGASLTNYLAKFTSATNIENSSLVYDSGTAVGIGTTAPAATLHVVSTSTSAGFVDVYSNTLNAVTFATRAARGTPTAPAVVQAGDIIGGFTGRGWTGPVSGSTGGFSGGRGALIIHANETWSTTAQSTYMQFNTTALGAAAQSERMRLDNAGNLGIGTSNPGGTPPSPLPAPVTLEVNGNVKLTAGSGGGVTFQDGTTQTTAVSLSGVTPGVGGGISVSVTGANPVAVSGTSDVGVAVQGVSGSPSGTAGIGVYGYGQGGGTGLYGASDSGWGLQVNGDSDLEGNLVVNGLSENGNESLTDEPPQTGAASGLPPAIPYKGLVLRRINSSIQQAGEVVAVAQLDNNPADADPNTGLPPGVSLQRDGTMGGFVLVTDPTLPDGTPIQINCQAFQSNNQASNFNAAFSSLQANPTTQVYSNGASTIFMHCIFGRLEEAGNFTEVTLTRRGNTPIWVGTVISDTNQ